MSGTINMPHCGKLRDLRTIHGPYCCAAGIPAFIPVLLWSWSCSSCWLSRCWPKHGDDWPEPARRRVVRSHRGLCAAAVCLVDVVACDYPAYRHGGWLGPLELPAQEVHLVGRDPVLRRRPWSLSSAVAGGDHLSQQRLGGCHKRGGVHKKLSGPHR